jgi:hypothetical protein
MAKPNYRHLKKQRETIKKREQETKREKRKGSRDGEVAPDAPPAPAPELTPPT